MPKTWEVKDPAGLTHIVQFDGDWQGINNLTHTIDVMKRPLILSGILWQLEHYPEAGEWQGFAWLKL